MTSESSSNGALDVLGGDDVLDSFVPLWFSITFWAAITSAAVHFFAGLLGVRVIVHSSRKKRISSPNRLSDDEEIPRWKVFLLNSWRVFRIWALIPLSSALLGFIIGTVSGGIVAVMLAAIYVSIPYRIGADTAFGLGVGMSMLIAYVQLGRKDFAYMSPRV